ncbi:MAG: hypothetical protein ACREBS_10280 [Nitrososphaerales archaeon]
MVDDVAGEKERRSFEALFFSLRPSNGTAIFLGKYTVEFTLSIITAGLGLVGTLIGLNQLGGAPKLSLTLSPIFPEIFGTIALAALSVCAR